VYYRVQVLLIRFEEMLRLIDQVQSLGEFNVEIQIRLSKRERQVGVIGIFLANVSVKRFAFGEVGNSVVGGFCLNCLEQRFVGLSRNPILVSDEVQGIG
jgi:hypothetical protein